MTTPRGLPGALAAWLGAAALAALAAACSAPGGPGSASDRNWRGDAGATADAPLAPGAPGLCRPVWAAERLPARRALVGARSQQAGPAATPKQELVEDLYLLFRSHCGACHVETGSGNFKVAQSSFSGDMDRARVIASITSDDPAKMMPPPAAGGMPYSRRVGGDPVLDLQAKLEAWFDQGKPTGLYTPPVSALAPGSGPATISYRVTEELSAQLTNLGSCIPEPSMYGRSSAAMDELDALFASATQLPRSLAETDLVSMDAAVLAERGVIGFVPTYPLWSDDAAKMRAVRVPRGQSIHFDKETQRFVIPPNTRFYKTFLKKIIDVDGKQRYRKIETRLIVSRADDDGQPGFDRVKALFGTYVWNDDETEARLLEDPLKNGKPFKDRVITYVTDEPRAQKVRQEVQATPGKDLAYALTDENPGLMRRYALPGSERCLECHMGSPSADFVLGFTPLQINHRRPGHGGIYEETGADELNQLERLIQYGVITGISSREEILPLEAPQGDRTPRNEHELQAQAYMIGNCAHCHNPRGFPSVKEPLLARALDFLPSAEGGIFRFPLDRLSPVRRRGVDQDHQMPYITPSLRDFEPSYRGSDSWTPKCADDCQEDEASEPWCGPRKTGRCLEAPWRSLLYRVVDTPFIYADDYAIFPHMPRNTAGFDCRAPRIFGSWMVSIPAVRISSAVVPEETDTEPQPFREAVPGKSDYAGAERDAQTRLRAFQEGRRYAYCPDTSDIVDPKALRSTRDPTPKDSIIMDERRPGKWLMLQDGVPDRAHWVVSDSTDPPVEWGPRRTDWKKFLVSLDPADAAVAETLKRQKWLGDTLEILRGVTITDELRRFAREPFPLGLWKGGNCEPGESKTVADFAGAQRPLWMKLQPVSPAAEVYETPPGSFVFSQICVNCHGQRADSKGLLAETISDMTGGATRVANFRDGLLGPVAQPMTNVARAFAGLGTGDGAASTPSTTVPTAEDWAARYLAFMALGGTDRIIPSAALTLVSATPVLGEKRDGYRPPSTPNMLQMGQELCKQALPMRALGPVRLENVGPPVEWGGQGLITKNGDAELWLRMCNLGNRKVVRVVHLQDRKDPSIDPNYSFYWATPESYPGEAPVMNHLGEVETGVRPSNYLPLCVPRPAPTCASGADPCAGCAEADGRLCMQAQQLNQERKVPWCPEQLLVKDAGGLPKHRFTTDKDPQSGNLVYVDGERWAIRGAINAGLAAFLYLQDLQTEKVGPPPRHDQCAKQ